MESQFFSWKGWDIIDTMAFQFYDCELLVRLGEYEAGTKVDTIAMLYARGVMEFYSSDKVEASFNLILQIEQVDV